MTVFFLQNPAISRESQNDNGGQQAYNRFFTRSTLPPPRLSGLRFPTPVSHGRDLASRPGCTVPGEGVGSPCLRLASLGARRSILTPRNLRRSACARLHPRPGNAEVKFLPNHRQPAAARVARDSLCLPGYCHTDSGKTAAPQTFLPHPSASTARLRPSLRYGRGLYYGRCLR